MAATPNTFDYFNRAEPERVLSGTTDAGGFDYWNRGEPLIGIAFVASASGANRRLHIVTRQPINQFAKGM